MNRVHLEYNRRTIRIVLTKQGLEVIKDIESRYTKRFVRETNKLQMKEIKEFLNALEIINKILPRLDFTPEKELK